MWPNWSYFNFREIVRGLLHSSLLVPFRVSVTWRRKWVIHNDQIEKKRPVPIENWSFAHWTRSFICFWMRWCRKKKTTPKQFGPNHICCSRFWSLDITVGFSMATVAGCKSLLLRLAYTKILLEMRKVCKFRGWIYYKTSTGAFPQFFFCNFLSYLWCYWMNAPRV